MPEDEQNSQKEIFNFQVTLLVHTPQSVLTQPTPWVAEQGFCSEGCYGVVDLQSCAKKPQANEAQT